MPEVIIKYKKPETLRVLEALAEPLAFEIAASLEEDIDTKTALEKITVPAKTAFSDATLVNGVTIISGDQTIDIQKLAEVFTGKNWDAKALRESAWRRKK